MKLTKRKGFNFFRSYYDVYNELNDKDKVAFIDALLNRQFLGIKPEDLKGLAKFAYISQTNSIDSQVKGYEDKTRTKLLNTPTVGGPQGGRNTPTLQVEEKEKEKVEYTKTQEQLFLEDWNALRLKHLKKQTNLKMLSGDDKDNFKELSKQYNTEDFTHALIGLFKQKKLPNDNKVMQANPKHFLKFFNTYLTAYHDKNNALYGENKKEY